MKIDDLAQGLVDEAMKKYHERYDNELYKAATDGRDPVYCNRLIDNALALSGHPDYKLDRYEWSEEALAWLEKFVEPTKAQA